jgi:hypothetical protein
MNIICWLTNSVDGVPRRVELEASSREDAMRLALAGQPKGSTVSCRSPRNSEMVMDSLQAVREASAFLGIRGVA